jgi:nicotinate-nucleotide adenylyltransferase
VAVLSGSGEPNRIGLYGGTFDPVHNGHLQVAEVTRRELGLTQVAFVPAGQPWMKPNRQITPAVHRASMLRLALSGKSGFVVSDLEIKHSGPTYTVDTLRQLAQQGDLITDLYLILSWNTLAELPLWKEPGEIVRLCHIVAVPRPGYRQPDLAMLETKIKGISQKVVLLDKPVIDISSTLIRERLAQGQTIDDLVPPPVNEYIKKHRLYLSLSY